MSGDPTSLPDDGPSYIDDDLDTIEYPTTWKTKEGKILEIASMDTDHIINCLKMLEQVALQRRQSTLEIIKKRRISDSYINVDRPQEFVPDQYWSFRKELNKRKVEHKPKLQFDKPDANGLERVIEKLVK